MSDETIVEQRPILKEDYSGNNSGGGNDDKNVDNSSGNKNNRNIIIAVVVVIVLCCCCLVAGGAGYYYYTRMSSQNAIPSLPNDVVVPQSDSDPNDFPTGGLGNDILRRDTWQVMAPASVGLGCDQPIAADTQITVLQDPDSAGYWKEEWTVACASGDSLKFEVEFITDATGVTFNIRPLFE